MVIGHKNPDTDSICAALSYASYCREVRRINARACRAGSVNAQTRHALDTFKADDPALLADILPRISDIMIGRNLLFTFRAEDPLLDAYRTIVDNRFSFLPVVDDSDTPIGRVTALGIARIVGTLAGLGDPHGRPAASASGAGNRDDAAAILNSPLGGFVEAVGPTFSSRAILRDVRQEVNRYNEGGFIVTNDEGKLAGIVTRINFMADPRHHVALVDHNEYSQAVDGIEEAAVDEIIDHHRIGMERTNEPITVINRVVGSTCSIVADLFFRSGTNPSPQVAGLMLSGLLSDTVILNSPTATDFDREIAPRLAELAGVSMEDYGRKMFAAGSDVHDLTADTIINQDRKYYEEGGKRFSVSQVEMVGFQAFWDRAEEIGAAVDNARNHEDLYLAALMVTDITTSTTLLVVRAPANLLERIAYPKAADSVYELKDVLSRKKQVLPYLLELL